MTATLELNLLPGDWYWTKLLWKIKGCMSVGRLTDEQIIEIAKQTYVKHQFYPDGYGNFICCGGPMRHHCLGQEPMDDWFISRIYDEIHHGPKCGGKKNVQN